MDSNSISREADVFRFKGIEGLRGWLASIVMFHHIIWFTGMNLRYPALGHFDVLADYAVQLFIIISGFVITHLLLSKPEPYFPYITRRFLRIYPCYIICLVLGIATTYLNFNTFLSHPWGALTPPTERMALQLQSLNTGHLIPHIIAHLTLLHGIIPSNILYESEYMFLAPGWSLSLEWQFYLIAPLVIYAIQRSEKMRLLVATIVIAGFIAYKVGLFGVFFLPSILPGAAVFFMAGICTRLIVYRLPRGITFPIGLIVASLLFVGTSQILLPFYIWAVFICWLLSKDGVGGPAKVPVEFLRLALDSPIAKYMGDISYPLYLIHVPAIQFILYLCVRHAHLGLMPSFLVTFVAAPIVSVIGASAIHFGIERPIIKYSKSLFTTDKLRSSSLASETSAGQPEPR